MNQILTISTLLTLMRLALTPILVYALVSHAWVPALIIFFLAALSDVLDGACARWLQQETTFGAILDPFVDKIFMLSIYGTCTKIPALSVHVPHWFLAVIIIKELILIGGALFISLVVNPALIKPGWLGKAAMLLQVLYMGLVITSQIYPIPALFLALLFSLLVMTTIGAGFQYCMNGIKGVFACVLQ